MKPAVAQDVRRNELAQIHVAKKDLGLDEETYRAMLWAIARVRSSADLDWEGRKRVIDHLKAKGWKNKSKARPAPAKDKKALVGKIRALLINHPSGARSDAYADGVAKRMFGVEKFTWCDYRQLYAIVQALSIDTERKSCSKS